MVEQGPEERRRLDALLRTPESPGEMTWASATPEDELCRLLGDTGNPVIATEAVGLLQVQGTAHDPSDAIRRVTDVLTSVVEVGSRSLSLDDWSLVLPDWFVQESAPERSAEEDERWLEWWRALPGDDRATAASTRAWSLGEWVAWMSPEERPWRWWDAHEEGEGQVVVRVQVLDWPPVVGSLRWLLRVAGVEVTSEDLIVTPAS